MVRPRSCQVIYYCDTPTLGIRHQLFDLVIYLLPHSHYCVCISPHTLRSNLWFILRSNHISFHKGRIKEIHITTKLRLIKLRHHSQIKTPIIFGKITNKTRDVNTKINMYMYKVLNLLKVERFWLNLCLYLC